MSKNDGNDRSFLKIETYTKDIEKEVILFQTPHRVPFAKLKNSQSPVALPVRDIEFGNFVREKLYRKRKVTLARNTLERISETLSAKALYESKTEPIATRVARVGNCIYVATLNESFSVRVRPLRKVKELGFDVSGVNNPPVNFYVPSGMLASPSIEITDSYSLQDRLDLFFEIVNVRNKPDKLLVLTWIICALRPDVGSYPILIFQGEHGSGKSTASRTTHLLLDPSESILSNLPDNERDLGVVADKSWVLSFDNISSISPKMSDALCKLSTGGSFNARALYTDAGRITLKLKRPIIINGIDVAPERADLLDRSLVINLSSINKRLSELKVKELFQQNSGEIFVGFLQLLSAVLAREPEIKEYGNFRMADFARVGCAVESIIGEPEGTFISAYTENRRACSALLLDGDQVVNAILEVYEPDAVVVTNARDMHRLLINSVPMEFRRWFPQSAPSLAKRLHRISPELRRHGIHIDFPRRSESREIVIKLPSLQSPIWGGRQSEID